MPPKIRSHSFKLEIPGDDSVRLAIRGKMDIVRNALMNTLSTPVSHADIMHTALDAWIRQNHTGQQPTMTVSEE